MNLALNLMEHDRNAPQVVSFVRDNILRHLPRICEEQTFESSVHVEGNFERKTGEVVQVQEDEDLSDLREKYVGKMAFDKDGGRVLACHGCEFNLSQRARVLDGLLYSDGVC